LHFCHNRLTSRVAPAEPDPPHERFDADRRARVRHSRAPESREQAQFREPQKSDRAAFTISLKWETKKYFYEFTQKVQPSQKWPQSHSTASGRPSGMCFSSAPRLWEVAPPSKTSSASEAPDEREEERSTSLVW
jgi:hypothetical protein